MKISKKICVSILIVVLLVCAFASFTEVNATGALDKFTGNIPESNKIAKEGVTNITSTVLNIVRYAGSGIALIMLTFIFIKYMLSAASERAELKKNLIPFTIGAVVLFAASNIVGLMKTVTDEMFK